MPSPSPDLSETRSLHRSLQAILIGEFDMASRIYAAAKYVAKGKRVPPHIEEFLNNPDPTLGYEEKIKLGWPVLRSFFTKYHDQMTAVDQAETSLRRTCNKLFPPEEMAERVAQTREFEEKERLLPLMRTLFMEYGLHPAGLSHAQLDQKFIALIPGYKNMARKLVGDNKGALLQAVDAEFSGRKVTEEQQRTLDANMGVVREAWDLVEHIAFGIAAPCNIVRRHLRDGLADLECYMTAEQTAEINRKNGSTYIAAEILREAAPRYEDALTEFRNSLGVLQQLRATMALTGGMESKTVTVSPENLAAMRHSAEVLTTIPQDSDLKYAQERLKSALISVAKKGKKDEVEEAERTANESITCAHHFEAMKRMDYKRICERIKALSDKGTESFRLDDIDLRNAYFSLCGMVTRADIALATTKMTFEDMNKCAGTHTKWPFPENADIHNMCHQVMNYIHSGFKTAGQEMPEQTPPYKSPHMKDFADKVQRYCVNLYRIGEGRRNALKQQLEVLETHFSSTDRAVDTFERLEQETTALVKCLETCLADRTPARENARR